MLVHRGPPHQFRRKFRRREGALARGARTMQELRDSAGVGAPAGRPFVPLQGKRETWPGLLEILFYAAQGIPAYAYGPGLLSVAHGPNEYVDLRKVCDCAAIYALTAMQMLSS